MTQLKAATDSYRGVVITSTWRPFEKIKLYKHTQEKCSSPMAWIENDLAFLSCFFPPRLNVFLLNPWHFEIPSSKYESLSCTDTNVPTTIQSPESFVCAGAWKEGIIFHSNSFFSFFLVADKFPRLLFNFLKVFECFIPLWCDARSRLPPSCCALPADTLGGIWPWNSIAESQWGFFSTLKFPLNG